MTSRGFALFAYGFRPFFLMAGLYAFLSIAVWLTVLLAGWWPVDGPVPAHWHAHEMLFGFVSAAAAGFLLTAVPDWTGGRGFAGWPLVFLSAVWLAGRIALNPVVPLPPPLAAALDLVFLPTLAVTMLPSLVKARTARRLAYLLILGLLSAGNLTYHLDWIGIWPGAWETGARFTLNVVLLMLAVVAGRLVPAFTMNALRRRGAPIDIPNRLWLEGTAHASIVLVVLVDLALPDSAAAGWVALAAAVVHAVRVVRWRGWLAWREPILWVLHVGYAWVPAGLALKAVWLLAEAEFASAWIHALTIGAFATMILAVMSRASLGHTGRPLVAPTPVAIAYVLLTLAAIARVATPATELVLEGYAVAGGLWIVAFGLFSLVYAPILIRPRIDGRPG